MPASCVIEEEWCVRGKFEKKVLDKVRKQVRKQGRTELAAVLLSLTFILESGFVKLAISDNFLPAANSRRRKRENTVMQIMAGKEKGKRSGHFWSTNFGETVEQ